MFKVVKLGTMKSCVAFGKAEVEYSTTEFATAPDWLAGEGYHLTVFHSLHHAKAFTTWNHTIWEVEAEDEVPLPKKMKPEPLAFGYMDPELEFLSGKPRRWPPGTRMFKRVKLLREVA